ncbi:hypothetical protein ESCO_000313 [Escovopsis weberi]|uniref:Uncharacterized protein n=1 Tax=Escovopsis weberi TaxID=150374 RepID=A0A0M8MY21_ESCWE|nr:hypothetical protein ESCO_000313 [Escovopsis weberi]
MPPPSPSSSSPTHDRGACFDQPRHAKRKRIPEVHDGERERLSKRLSLLKLEQQQQQPSSNPGPAPGASTSFAQPAAADPAAPAHPPDESDESMQLDDSRHRIYIYSIDDELSSDSEPEDGRLVFHPDFRKHLRPSIGGGGGSGRSSSSSIPRRIVANDDGELAGMQLVLYREPKALSVPEEHDGVRKMVKEARQRLRDRQKMERLGIALPTAAAVTAAAAADTDTDVEVHDDNGNDDNDGDGDDDDDAMELD